MGTLAESLSTFITLKGVLALVDDLMFGKGGDSAESLPTVLTFIWPHSRVYDLVANELCTLDKGFSTLFTLKWLLPGVKPLMLSQVFAAAECFLAGVTLEVLLATPWMIFLF